MENIQSNCIFCKIAKKEIPAQIVYEDENFISFLDINPRAPGHVLVIPREHYHWVWQVPQYDAYWQLAKKIAEAQQKAFDTEAILVRVTGEEVPHAHIWVYPNPDYAQGEKSDFAGNAAKLKLELEK